jgi:hypothetical protein
VQKTEGEDRKSTLGVRKLTGAAAPPSLFSGASELLRPGVLL